MYLEKLKAILDTPKITYKVGSPHLWREVEHKYNYTLPQEYKMFIDTYGTGSISEFIHVFNALEEGEGGLFYEATIIRDAYNHLREKNPESFKLEIYPDKKGLLPWAITDNGDQLLFDSERNVVVVIGDGLSDLESEEYRMGIVEFLYKLLVRQIQCTSLPNDLDSIFEAYSIID